MRELQTIASESGEKEPGCGGPHNINPKSDRTKKSQVQTGMKVLKCEITDGTMHQLKIRAATDRVKLAEAAEKALLIGLIPPAPPPSIEEQLAALLHQVDRGIFEKLDRKRGQENKTWQHYAYQALTLLERQLSGQPLSLEPRFATNVRPQIQPPRPSPSSTSDNSRKTLPSDFMSDLGIVDMRDDKGDASGTRPAASKR